MTQNRYLIWTDDPYETESIEDYKARMEEEMPGELEGLSDTQIYERMGQEIADLLDDERMNLNVNVGAPILAIAELGLWNGHPTAYLEIESGNIADCLRSYVRGMSYSTMYVTGDGEFRQDESHHDGTNHYVFRAYRKGVSETQIDRLKEKLYEGTATQRDIDRCTRKLGPDIARVYGWQLPRTRSPAQRGR